jgi:hypothetical protein
MSLKSLHYHSSSVPAEEAATSSASVVDLVTHRCSVAFQLIGPPNRKKM